MQDITHNEAYESISTAVALWDDQRAKQDPNYFYPLENAAQGLADLAPLHVQRAWAQQLGLTTGLSDAEVSHHIASAQIDLAKERRLSGSEAWRLVTSGYISAIAAAGARR